MSESPRLYLHGFLGCAADFDAWIVAEETNIVFDLPGHGSTPEMGPISGDREGGFERCLEWIENRVLAADVDPVDVIGYSLGARLAYGLLVRGNIKVCCAALIGANPGIEDAGERSARAAKDDALAEKLEGSTSFDEWLNGWYQQPLFGSIESSIGYPETRERRSRGAPGALAEALRQMSVGRQPSYWDALESIEAERVLLVAGDDDPRFVEINARAAERIPHAATLQVSGTAHAVQVERPALARQLVDAFLM